MRGSRFFLRICDPPFNEPALLTRAWCLWEAYCALKIKKRERVGFVTKMRTPEQRIELLSHARQACVCTNIMYVAFVGRTDIVLAKDLVRLNQMCL